MQVGKRAHKCKRPYVTHAPFPSVRRVLEVSIFVPAGKSKTVFADISSHKGALGSDLAALAEQHCHISKQLEEAQNAAQAVHVLAELQQRLQDFDRCVATGVLFQTSQYVIIAVCTWAAWTGWWHELMERTIRCRALCAGCPMPGGAGQPSRAVSQQRGPAAEGVCSRAALGCPARGEPAGSFLITSANGRNCPKTEPTSTHCND